MEKHSLILLFFLSLHIPAFGHVTLLTPKEDTVYTAGDLVTIEWQLDVEHEQLNWDLWFSIDQGLTWTAIALDMPIDQLSYEWIFPGRSYEKFRIQIVQDNQGRDYHDTNQFDIGPATPIVTGLNGIQSDNILTLSSNPVTTSSKVLFNTFHGGYARISVFDQSGKHLLQVFDGELQPGNNEFFLIPQKGLFILKPGLYFLKVQSQEYLEVIRFIYPN